jgi:hypothetical protein
MQDYQIQPNSCQCAVTGRALKEDEKCYSVLIEQQGRFQRYDYSLEAWQGPPPGAIGCWSSRALPKEMHKRIRKDADALLADFHALDGTPDPEKLNYRYVIALLLLRSKKLQLAGANHDAGVEFMRLRCPRTHAEYQVMSRPLTELEIETVRNHVLQVVSWN